MLSCAALVMNNPAHFLTFLRIGLSPLFPLIYFGHGVVGLSMEAAVWMLLALLAVSEWSDFLDGRLARRRNQVTDLGKVLDPMADTVTHISLFLSFTQGVVGLPILLVLVFLYRDLLVTTLRTLCALKGVALAARSSGKVKAFLQGGVSFLILALMLPYFWGWISLGALQMWSVAAVSVAAGYTAFSVFDYLWANRRHLKELF